MNQLIKIMDFDFKRKFDSGPDVQYFFIRKGNEFIETDLFFLYFW